jgi:glycosyltransferase involved in cell wall biosynthesis
VEPGAPDTWIAEAVPGRRRRVLLSAYACEPGKGSEPWVGWNWALQAARFHDVWVLTRAANREAIASAPEAAARPNLRFEYYDLPRWMRFWKRGGRGIRLYYLLWQLGAVHVARRLHVAVAFEVMHHVTFNSMDLPGFLWMLDVPFVWGPVGGGQEPSPALSAYFGRERLQERLRLLRKRLARFNPLLRGALRRAAAVLTANEDTERKLVRLGARTCVRELETAVALPAPRTGDPSAMSGERLRILWAGNLVRLKGPRLALDALAALKRRGVTFEALFVGDGPLRAELGEWVRQRGLDTEVAFTGRVSHPEMAGVYERSQVLLFTSLRDTSGNVVLEAMAHGLPVVALDQHGAREILDADSGMKVPILDQAQVVRDLAAALERLALDPALRRAQGRAGRSRVEHRYNWDQKGELLRRLYTSVGREPSQAAPAPAGRL